MFKCKLRNSFNTATEGIKVIYVRLIVAVVVFNILPDTL